MSKANKKGYSEKFEVESLKKRIKDLETKMLLMNTELQSQKIWLQRLQNEKDEEERERAEYEQWKGDRKRARLGIFG